MMIDQSRRTCRRSSRGRLFAALGFLVVPIAVQPFGGEDFLEGNPWHHEMISRDALKAKGFAQGAEAEIAWNADYVDSYLYNPLWWAQGGLSRFKVALANYDELAKVHFDDNFSGDQIRRTWRRYLSGCMAGLVWAAERNDIAGARNLIGVSLHGVQDFYSHSNWIDDPARRNTTWFKFDRAKRDLLTVYAGAYEHAAQTGVKPHGKIVASPTILRQPLLKPFMELAASPYSPLHNSALVQLYLQSKDALPIQPKIFDVKVPDNVLYVNPPGMNLDTLWSSGIGVRVRGLTDLTGPQAFGIARKLAEQASEEWLGIIEDRLKKLGYEQFWGQVKNAPETQMKEKQYEDYSRFPYQFISAGPYPPDLGAPEEEVYLRLQIRTAADMGAGTDADIWLEADGKRFLLDYMPRCTPLLAYNDFEKGDNQVYTVGPLPSLPRQITFFNDSANAADLQRAVAQHFIDAARVVADTVGSSLLSIVAGHADHVADGRIVWSAAELSAIPAAGKVFSIQVNGGQNGVYRIDGKVMKTGQSPGTGSSGWHEFRVTLASLYCIREGVMDRFSPSEEPYVLALAVPFPGNLMKYKTAPIPDTDTGETKRIGYTFPTIRVPKAYGMLSLPVSVWESDSESEATRRQQLDTFADEAKRRTAPVQRELDDTLGAAVGADWKVASLSVYAFNRGGTLKCGTVFDRSVNEWIKGKARTSYALNTSGMTPRSAVVAKDLDVLAKSPPPASSVERPSKDADLPDLSGQWENANSSLFGWERGSDTCRVEHSGHNLKVIFEKSTSDYNEYKAGDVLFTGLLTWNPSERNWTLSGKRLYRSFRDAPSYYPKMATYDTEGDFSMAKDYYAKQREELISIDDKLYDRETRSFIKPEFSLSGGGTYNLLRYRDPECWLWNLLMPYLNSLGSR